MKLGGVALGISLTAHLVAVLAIRAQPPPPMSPRSPPVELVELEAAAPVAPSGSRPAATAALPRPTSSARAASLPRAGSPLRASQASQGGAVAVEVGEEEAAGEAGPAGSGRYYDAWKVDSLPMPRATPTLGWPGTEAGLRIDLDVTVTASGRVGGVVALGSPLAELAAAVARALTQVRFTPATVAGSAVSTTVPVTVLLVASDGGASGWEAGGTGWVLRLEREAQ